MPPPTAPIIPPAAREPDFASAQEPEKLSGWPIARGIDERCLSPCANAWVVLKKVVAHRLAIRIVWIGWRIIVSQNFKNQRIQINSRAGASPVGIGTPKFVVGAMCDRLAW
jgi:hypothetical protein